jgi:hypothetical protein
LTQTCGAGTLSRETITPAARRLEKLMGITIDIKGASAQGEESLCRTCHCAHIRRGFRQSEEAIFCNFGDQLRPVPFKVAECTDYANRNVPHRYELEQMALLINVPRARKKAGFKNDAGFARRPEEEDDSASTTE